MDMNIRKLKSGVHRNKKLIQKPPESSRMGHRKTCPDAHLATAVASKIEAGNLRAAIRLVCSNESVAPFTADTAAVLRAKHPSSTLGAEPLPDPGDFPALVVSHVEIKSAIRSFPAGSGGGSDGLRPQHLVDLINCKESGLDFVSRLTDFVNLLLEGKCPERIRQILFGGRLVALRKKDGASVRLPWDVTGADSLQKLPIIVSGSLSFSPHCSWVWVFQGAVKRLYTLPVDSLTTRRTAGYW